MALALETYQQLLTSSGLLRRDQLSDVLNQINQQAPHRRVDSQILSQHLLDRKLITPWQHSKLMKGCSKGFFIGKYKLLAHLGTGGMSRVYLAVHTMMKRQVAIKVLNQKLTESESHLQRFLRESQAAAALDHANVVRAYDVDCDRNLYYFVMEYVEGPTLQQLVERKGPLAYEYAAEYIRQAAEGLQHAHDAALVHRDIKPGNLLVNKHGVVKVLDLGMVRLSSEEVKSITIQFNESMLGTADYLSPEQALDSHHVDNRADVYSLGCTFYFLLTGHPPFPDGSMAVRLMRHQSEPPPDIRNDRPDCPDELIRICMKMVAKAADDRYQQCREIATDLKAWLESQKAAAGANLANYNAASTDDTVAAGNANTVVNSPGQSGILPKAVDSPSMAGPRSAVSTNRPDDFNAWKYRDFENALIEGDSRIIPAVGTLCSKYADNERVVAFMVRLVSSANVAQSQVDSECLRAVLHGLGVMKTKTAMKTLMRVVVGSINMGLNDRQAVGMALEGLASNMNHEREKFLVELLANAEDARPQGKTEISAGQLRSEVARVLHGRVTERVRSELENRLSYRSLSEQARDAIRDILDNETASA